MDYFLLNANVTPNEYPRDSQAKTVDPDLPCNKKEAWYLGGIFG
jgi:hypothetical protein